MRRKAAWITRARYWEYWLIKAPKVENPEQSICLFTLMMKPLVPIKRGLPHTCCCCRRCCYCYISVTYKLCLHFVYHCLKGRKLKPEVTWYLRSLRRAFFKKYLIKNYTFFSAGIRSLLQFAWTQKTHNIRFKLLNSTCLDILMSIANVLRS